MRLGVDPRKADQIVRGTLSLPSGTGTTVRVAVFAAGEAATEARAAGADEVGADDLVAKINGGFLDFDIAIATPDLMGQVGTLGRVLGPRGLMPNPKTGTVTTDVAKAVGEFKGGRVEYRTDKVGNVHIRVGKASFTHEQLVANIRAVVDELQRAKPPVGQGPLLPVGDGVDHHGPRHPHRPGQGSLHRRGAGRLGLTRTPVGVPPADQVASPEQPTARPAPPTDPDGRALNPTPQTSGAPSGAEAAARPARRGDDMQHTATPCCAVAHRRSWPTAG